MLHYSFNFEKYFFAASIFVFLSTNLFSRRWKNNLILIIRSYRNVDKGAMKLSQKLHIIVIMKMSFIWCGAMT